MQTPALQQQGRRAGHGLPAQRPTQRRFDSDRLQIAMLAPPWIPVPAPGYGGIEPVVEALCEELVRMGHDVTLFTTPGSRSSATVYPLLARAHPDEIDRSLYEADHVARAFEAFDRAAAAGEPFDVVHDHCGFTALAMADRCAVPIVHTVHVPFTPDTRAFYEHHGGKAEIVGISRAQLRSAPPRLRSARVIPNPLAVDRFRFSAEKQDYLLWMGRMAEYKGAHRAIDAARAAGRRLVLAGPVQPGQEAYFGEHVQPRLQPGRFDYIGEVGGSPKQHLLAGAAGLLMPIRWEEPFGMVMIEALAAGTPVIAFSEGAANEIVIPGENGYLVEDEQGMATAIARLDEIDATRCRASVTARYDPQLVAQQYLAAYVAARDHGARSSAP